ncbi:MAG: proteasome subunit beta [Candidatus Poribacteria bacterium]|nr:MAG: proteasome subunit beta [Candidatus Poribacteria bacterium]
MRSHSGPEFLEKLAEPSWPRTDFQGDFLALLRDRGYSLTLGPSGPVEKSLWQPVESTTVLAVRYDAGVLVAGDRRATSGTTVMYDRADKVLEIDEHSVLAISGSPALAYEMARILEYSFRYYRRSQLQELSLEGKLRTLSRLIRENLQWALQGIGAVLPIFAAYDPATERGHIYFYDLLGTQFESAEFAVAGSGSVWIRGALYYQNRWLKRLETMSRDEATTIALRMLQAAAHYDAATSGIREETGALPVVKFLTQEGIETLDESLLRRIYQEFVETVDV